MQCIALLHRRVSLPYTNVGTLRWDGMCLRSTLCRFNFLRPGLKDPDFWVVTAAPVCQVGKLLYCLVALFIATTEGGRLRLDDVEGRDNSRWQVAATAVVGRMR